MCGLCYASGICLSDGDDFSVSFATVASTSRFLDIVERDWVQFIEIRPYPREDNGLGVSRTRAGFFKHALFMVLVQLYPLGAFELGPVWGVEKEFAGKLGQCNSFSDGGKDHVIRDGWPLGWVVPTIVFVVADRVEVMSDDGELVELESGESFS